MSVRILHGPAQAQTLRVLMHTGFGKIAGLCKCEHDRKTTTELAGCAEDAHELKTAAVQPEDSLAGGCRQI